MDGRKYFEDGCLCIAGGEVSLADQSLSNEDAALYYEEHCTCSRNYKHLEGETN